MRADSPISLTGELRALGVEAGQDLLIHSSLRRLGVGPQTLLNALREAAGPEATLVVPTQTPLSSPTSSAFRAATEGLDGVQRAHFLAGLPGFDRAATPSVGMGVFAEHLRTRPQAWRSGHPLTSFAALGPRAGSCTAVHDLDCQLGERSPLGWLYATGAAVLLLGVGYWACTALHLAEYRLPMIRRAYSCVISEAGSRRECEFLGALLDDSDFETLGKDLDQQSFVRRARVGAADCRLLPLRTAVEFAAGWFRHNRNWPASC